MNWRIIKYILPYGIINHKKDIMKIITSPLYFLPRKCPLCGTRMFRFSSWSAPFGGHKIKDWVCFGCGSHPRHRRLWLYLMRKTKILEQKDAHFLHIAPDSCFVKIFKNIFKNYLTADLYRHNVMVRMDITNIEYPDESFDIIFCLHVLEHIPDDNKAMVELYRILKKGGVAIIMIPQTSNYETYEDWSITTPEGRLKAFGQHDHVRRYGLDFKEKLQVAGFNVSVIQQNNYLLPKEINKYLGRNKNENIFYCGKG